jgi:hypothetical protein
MKLGRNGPFPNQEKLMNALNNVRKVFLDKKPHIKKYNKIRKMYAEMVSTMAQYYHDGKFEKREDPNFSPEPEHEKTKELFFLESNFDLDTELGAHSFYDMWIYKTAPNVMCITEEFIRKCRYRSPEKIELLHSMLASKLGLFEITGTDVMEGYAYLKDVFTGDEYTMVDIALSGNRNTSACYLYTRIISYQDINFGSGLNFFFLKKDDFIKKHIQEHKNDFKPNGEFLRFTQLYNRYSQDLERLKVFYQ